MTGLNPQHFKDPSAREHIKALARRLAIEQAALKHRKLHHPKGQIPYKEYVIRSRKIQTIRAAINRELNASPTAS